MKRILSALLVLAVLLSLAVPAFAAEPSYTFRLSVDGKTTKQVSTGDIITVVLNLDSSAAAPMYAMQDEIYYDEEFFELVEGSTLVSSGIQTTDIAVRGHRRAFYMNYLSFGGGAQWNQSNLIGSFQLRVIGTTGSAKLSNNNYLVSKQDGSGSFACTAQDVTVTISDQCLVKFDTRGGSEVASQTVRRGGTVTKPADPTREGYTFGGWYADVDYSRAWNFASDKVENNCYLYAKWVKGGSGGSIYSDVKESDWFFDAVNYVTEHGLMNGVGGGKFGPQQNTSRAMIVTILWRLEGSPTAQTAMTFRDVKSGKWYTDAIGWAAENGIVTGYSAASFGPDDKITREQMAAILYRYCQYKGIDVSEKADLSAYVDASSVSSWAKDALAWANAAGLITGMPGNKLAPKGSAVRCQTATILMRFRESIQ